jgi:hypothetical protein
MIPKIFFVLLLVIAAPVVFALLFSVLDSTGVSNNDNTQCYVVTEEHETFYTLEECK